MSEGRRPAAFRIEPSKTKANPQAKRKTARRPQAVRTDEAVITPAPADIFEEEELAAAEPAPASPPRRRSRLGAIFLSSFGILVSLAVGLWTDRLIRDLFSRAEWLGWLAIALAAIAGLALLIIVLREVLALFRLASVERLQTRARGVIDDHDTRKARSLVDDLSRFLARRPETAAGRRALADLQGEVIDAPDLLRLAENELLAPLDATAQKLVLDAAKRVSLVTAISPRALVDIAYVVFENGRLIRRLAEIYGARPGTIGFFRLARNVLAHLAVTGSMAAGETFVQQIVGHGLAARLSAKLGEGVVNGMMTARIGTAAIETVRPLPFHSVKRPSLGEYLRALTAFASQKDAAARAGKD